MAEFTTSFDRALNQPALRFNCDVTRVPRVDAEWLINFLENQVKAGHRYKEGETLQIGWMVTRLARENDAIRILEPDMAGVPVSYIDSVDTTLTHLRSQRDVCASCGLEEEIDFPYIGDSIIVPKNYRQLENMYLVRDVKDGNVGGWMAHDISNIANQYEAKESDFSLISLYEFSCIRPDLVMFLALPVGTGVQLSAGGNTRIIRGDNELPIKPESFLDLLNRARAGKP